MRTTRFVAMKKVQQILAVVASIAALGTLTSCYTTSACCGKEGKCCKAASECCGKGGECCKKGECKN